MDARLQRRVQRYGWDLAAADYEALWQAALAPAQQLLLAQAALRPGERVLDLACGTGLVSLAAARAVGPRGHVLGTDLSARMVAEAGRRADAQGLRHADFARMDAETLALPDGGFDAVLCGFGLMYLPDPAAALREARRVLKPGGRIALAVWGERARCGWAGVFGIVDAEVHSEVCPLFFDLGGPRRLQRGLGEAGFEAPRETRLSSPLHYADGDEACRAAFAGGPVALAWSRFDAATRQRVCERYLETLAPHRQRGGAYRVPAEFVIANARTPAG